MISYKFDKFLWDLSDAFRTGIVKNVEEEDALTKYLFAKYFGWTPKQVDELSYRDVLIFRKLIEVEAKEREYMMSKMERREWRI